MLPLFLAVKMHQNWIFFLPNVQATRKPMFFINFFSCQLKGAVAIQTFIFQI